MSNTSKDNVAFRTSDISHITTETLLSPRSRLHALDALRGIAALYVLVFHYFNSVRIPGIVPNPAISYGYLAVEFFFILSGYILSRRYFDELETHKISLSRFALHRIARMGPLHWLTLLLMAAMEWSVAQMPFEHQSPTIFSFLLNAVFLQNSGLGGYGSFNGPSWSISAEMIVNLICSAMVFYRVKWFWYALLFCVSVSTILLSPGKFGAWTALGSTFVSGGVLICFFTFIFGAFIERGTIFFKARSACFDILFLLGVALLFGFYQRPGAEIVYIFAAFPLIVLGAARSANIEGLMSAWPLRSIGEASYSIYMLHFPILFAFGLGGVKFGDIKIFAAYLISVLVLSIFSYRFLEQPAYRLLRNLNWPSTQRQW